MRSQSTSLESVIETLCLGDPVVQECRKFVLEEFTRLWNLVFGMPRERDPQHQLPKVSHQTGGMLYYFSLDGGKSGLTVKVYLPVRHYAKGDREAAASLKEYIRKKSQADFSGNYTKAIGEIMWVHNYMQHTAQRMLITIDPAGIIRFERSERVCRHISPLLLNQRSLVSQATFHLPFIFQLPRSSC